MQSELIYASYKWNSELNKTQFEVDKLCYILPEILLLLTKSFNIRYWFENETT